jgi:S1-C subfamily serine protease
MKSVKRIVLVVSLLALTAAASTASAQTRIYRFDPSGGGSRNVQFLGLRCTVIPGYGYRVNTAWHRTVGQRIGFESGDVILSINGRPLTYAGAHQSALQQAYWNGGWFSFAVQDIRTGRVLYRRANLYQ